MEDVPSVPQSPWRRVVSAGKAGLIASGVHSGDPTHQRLRDRLARPASPHRGRRGCARLLRGQAGFMHAANGTFGGRHGSILTACTAMHGRPVKCAGAEALAACFPGVKLHAVLGVSQRHQQADHPTQTIKALRGFDLDVMRAGHMDACRRAMAALTNEFGAQPASHALRGGQAAARLSRSTRPAGERRLAPLIPLPATCAIPARPRLPTGRGARRIQTRASTSSRRSTSALCLTSPPAPPHQPASRAIRSARPQGRILSGVQPTGNLHLGNYLGAIAQLRARCRTTLRLPLLRRRPARHHACRRIRPSWPRQTPRGRRGLHRLRHRSARSTSCSTSAMVPSTPSSPGCSTASPASAGSNRMTQFKEKAGKDRENASARPLRLSGADGGRHPGLHARRTCRSARTRSSISS